MNVVHYMANLICVIGSTMVNYQVLINHIYHIMTYLIYNQIIYKIIMYNDIHNPPNPYISWWKKHGFLQTFPTQNSIHGGFPIGFPLINHPFLGIPIYGNSHIMPHEYMAFCCLFFFPCFQLPFWWCCESARLGLRLGREDGSLPQIISSGWWMDRWMDR